MIRLEALRCMKITRMQKRYGTDECNVIKLSLSENKRQPYQQRCRICQQCMMHTMALERLCCPCNRDCCPKTSLHFALEQITVATASQKIDWTITSVITTRITKLAALRLIWPCLPSLTRFTTATTIRPKRALLRHPTTGFRQSQLLVVKKYIRLRIMLSVHVDTNFASG